MAIVFTHSGWREAQAMLKGAAQRLANTRPVRKYMGEEALVRTQQRLRAGVDIDGRPFKVSRRAEEFGGQTMWDRGALASSVNYATPDGAVELFSSNKAAGVHWRGDTVLPKNGQYLTIPLRANGGVYNTFAGANAPMANRTGVLAGNFSKSSTFILRRGGLVLLMQRIGKNVTDSGAVRRSGHRRRKGEKPSGGPYSLRALFLLVRSVKLPQRRWFGWGTGDLDAAAEQLGDFVTSGKVAR